MASDWLQMLTNLLRCSMVVCVVFVIVVAGQSKEDEKIFLPDAVMQQVVNRIVRWQFKPLLVGKTIPIYDPGLRREWLPTIPNVTFDLVSEEGALKYEKGVFIFEKLRKEGAVYLINVGWGDVDCAASGETWKFRVGLSNNVRLWRTGGGWGRGCGHSGTSAPQVRGLKLGDVSPNELSGYEFFRKGKLKDIRLGISTRDDMKKIFGSTCEGVCEYDKDWSIFVNYFEQGKTGTQTTTSEGVETKLEFTPKPGIIGRLRFVTLTPKNCISFLRTSFSKVFSTNKSYYVGDDWGENGFEGAVHSTRDIYTDGYGLRYGVFDQETFNNLTFKPQSPKRPLQKGDLVEVEYNIPDSLHDQIYDSRIIK